MSQTQLTRADLWSLEAYSEKRAAFKAEVLEHKRNRRIALGDHVLLLFGDVTTIRYQIQEMLRKIQHSGVLAVYCAKQVTRLPLAFHNRPQESFIGLLCKHRRCEQKGNTKAASQTVKNRSCD